MTAEIIILSECRGRRIVRVKRLPRPESFDPYGLVIPVAALVGLAMWGAILVNTAALFVHARPPD
jgi:hypothetical protein